MPTVGIHRDPLLVGHTVPQVCGVLGGWLPDRRFPSSGGDALLVSLAYRSVLHHFHFKGSVHSISFSPDGR